MGMHYSETTLLYIQSLHRAGPCRPLPHDRTNEQMLRAESITLFLNLLPGKPCSEASTDARTVHPQFPQISSTGFILA